MVEVPADLLAEIDALANEEFEMWKTKANAEQKAVGKAEMARYMSDPEFAASETAKMHDAFVASDADGNGVLNLEEWLVYMTKLNDNAKANGHYVDESEDTPRKMYALANRINPATEGVSEPEFGKIMELFFSKHAEWHAAA